MGTQAAKNFAAGPDGLSHLRVDLVPEDGFGKGQTEATHSIFETGQDILRWDALRGGILGVAAPQALIDQGGVFDRTGQGPHRIESPTEGKHASSADLTYRGFEAYCTTQGGRDADGTPCITAQRHRHHTSRNRHTRATT